MTSEKTYLGVEDLDVYRMLCDLHLEVCALSSRWPKEEIYELGSQIRHSSNSAPAQLAEKNDDRHVRNKVEGVNRARGEAAETIHHLYIASRKGYVDSKTFEAYRTKYKQCIRMLNGLERKLEEKLPGKEQRWNVVREERPGYIPSAFILPDTRHPKPETSLVLTPETYSHA